MAIWLTRHPMDPDRPRLYRVEHHEGNTIAVLGLLPDVAPHHRSLDPFLSALLRGGAEGQLRLVDEATGTVVARRRVAPFRSKAIDRIRG